MELIYILTYDCNFRCSYCDIDKRKEDISKNILEESINFLNKNNFNIKKTKFFG
jgi:sulfatase maturation enzyme AslB (radical SAM superfamily)